MKILTTPPSNLLGQGRFQQINPFKMTRGRVKTKYFLQNDSNSNRCNKVDKYKCQLNVLSLQKLELWVESSLRSNQTQAWYYELRWIHRSFQKLAKLARIMDHYTMILHIQIDSNLKRVSYHIQLRPSLIGFPKFTWNLVSFSSQILTHSSVQVCFKLRMFSLQR